MRIVSWKNCKALKLGDGDRIVSRVDGEHTKLQFQDQNGNAQVEVSIPSDAISGWLGEATGRYNASFSKKERVYTIVEKKSPKEEIVEKISLLISDALRDQRVETVNQLMELSSLVHELKNA